MPCAPSAYWRELRRGDEIPARADIAPGRIGGILQNIELFDMGVAPRRYRIRLMGIEIVSWYGSDLTGCYLEEIDMVIGAAFALPPDVPFIGDKPRAMSNRLVSGWLIIFC